MAFIEPSNMHRSIDGIQLARYRERMNLSQQQFANRCGWSQQFQSKLECPGRHEVNIDVVRQILFVLKS